MAIQMRRGNEVDFDSDKMLPGEWAVSLDRKYVRMCFAVGQCIRMATYDAFEEDMAEVRDILAECQSIEEAVIRINELIAEQAQAVAEYTSQTEQNATIANEAKDNARRYAETATTNANTAINKAEEAISAYEMANAQAKLSRSYAVGGTGTRSGEDTDNAKYYKEQAVTAYQNATREAAQAANKAEVAEEKSTEAEASANRVQSMANTSESYAVGRTGTRPGENTDNAQYYYEQARNISEGLKGALMPMGTVLFEGLPRLEDVNSGWMYNISNEFTTTSEFKEGAGKRISLGSNIYKTADGYWDVLAGSPVTGVKGVNEQTYRQGNVEITPENLGLDNTKDINKNVLSAKKLATARALQTNLASTQAVSFDGTGNAVMGVTGVLGEENGGTGKKTLKDSANALINALESVTGIPDDNTLIITKSTESSVTTYHRRPMSKLWDYIKSKMTGAVSSILTTKLGTNLVLVSNSGGGITTSSVDVTKLGHLRSVTSDIQAQLNGKQPILKSKSVVFNTDELGIYNGDNCDVYFEFLDYGIDGNNVVSISFISDEAMDGAHVNGAILDDNSAYFGIISGISADTSQVFKIWYFD